MKITPTKRGFNIQHTTREVWGVDDPSESQAADSEESKAMRKIATQIRQAIDRSVYANGPNVIAIDHTQLASYRIINVRVKAGVLEGKALTSGKWFAITSCSALDQSL